VSFPLGGPEAEHNLALLNHYFWLRSNRSDRYRFLRTYLAARTSSSPLPPLPRMARSIEQATRAWAERLWRRWGRRRHGTNKYFWTASRGSSWSIASRDLDRTQLATLMNDPDAPFGWPGSTILKDSRTTTVAELVLKVRGCDRAVIYKRFNQRRWFDPFLTY